MGYGNAALVRLPTFDTTTIDSQDAQTLLRHGRAGLLSFLLEPDEHHPANGWLYVCHDQSYTLGKLANEVRRHVRRAQGSLRIEPIGWRTLLAHGFSAYNDTRARLGLSDGSLTHFGERFNAFASYPGHYAVGAWKGETLVAFVTLIVVDDWVAMEGSFSANAALALRPNNGLAHYVLDYFLVKQKCATVTFGASSIQESSQHSGLHDFKVRIGFEAKPVHRAFILRAALRPLANGITLWLIKTALRFRPGNPYLSKAVGVLNYILYKQETDIPRVYRPDAV
jgi:hypothetical protein